MACISVLEARCNEAQKKLLGLEQENETTKKKNSELKRENARFVLFSYCNNCYYFIIIIIIIIVCLFFFFGALHLVSLILSVRCLFCLVCLFNRDSRK